MRNFRLITVALSATFLILATGCGNIGSLAPVSGTVTYDGEPVPKLKVVFSPEPVGDNNNVGPYSQGVTDENGRFKLATRYKDNGAFIGRHRLVFEYEDISQMALVDLQTDMNDAMDADDKERVEKLEKRIAEVEEKLKGRPLLTNFQAVLVDVPTGGIADYQLDLKTIEKE